MYGLLFEAPVGAILRAMKRAHHLWVASALVLAGCGGPSAQATKETTTRTCGTLY